ncbi:glycoside hydrolase family 3 protein [Actinomyces sp. MRS3W]|uniref:glycoside hydrolase family 3 protein n=1 Tax=Actinomyces sp. MRS3W TaxID=2800796 RepID=UPI0028FD17F2|nr:glycoside hydrolase family 3 N-terminal domain-containing protein [Actinomyces sp. MRS3W]MDU0347583.1 glycoside hydrolase family 3 C-terminal domain-containing protein [Actinomyces sp. MRS3W]
MPATVLSINWNDVWNVVVSLRPQLIVIAVALLAAIIITIAVRKLNTPARKLTRATTWVAATVAVALAITGMMYGGLKTILDLSSGSGVLAEETKASVEELGNTISDEGMVLLKNEDATLPLEDGSSINVLGWASTNPVYGGTGSGSLSPDNPTTSLLDGLQNAGFKTNTTLSDFYTDYRAERPEVGMFAADWTLPEPTADAYTDALVSSIQGFSDTSVVTIARSGGEGFDLPQDVNAEVESNGAFSYTNNSTTQTDFADGQGYLELTAPERDLIALAKDNSETVIVVYNGANAFDLSDLAADPDIDAIIWAIPGGQVGFNALGRILDGEVNPSAKTPDTFAADYKQSPAANNFGDFTYTNMEEYGQSSPFTGGTTYPAFVNYVEGIYVGYRWYETAAVEGVIDYDATVTYPFGYGLSYTTFTQEMGELSRDADGAISLDVTVTNTGDVAGKDVVEVYYTPPYTNGGIEKSAVNLVAYGKTGLLEPGASETVTITFAEDDMASYDYRDAAAYVLEAGEYTISLRSDSHTVIDEQTLTVDQTITYDSEGNTHADDVVAATNQFDAAAGDVTYLSRADAFANYDEATAAPASLEMAEEYQATFVANSNYDSTAFDNDSDQMPTTGADNGLVLGDMYGLDYDDEKWEQLLDQLSVADMNNLIANGGYGSVAVDSVGKVRVSDVDGPASLNNNFTGVGSIGLPSAVSVAATWNKELAHEFGTAIGTMAHDMDVAGWYAPATNTHRYAYAGRNFEYFSEDPVLAGTQVAQEIQGAKELGVYAFIKHFAMNDQETNRTNMLATWSNEQAIREIYLKPFEIGIKEGGAGAVMTAFNYIGTTYAGALPELQQTVLRDEWGFRGMTLTDYFAGYGYQNADQLTRNGGDMMLATTDITVNSVQNTSSATGVLAMREASHNILYTVANSWIYENGQPEVQRASWEYLTWGVLAVLGLVLIGLELLAIKRFRTRRAEAAAGKTAEATTDQPADSDD